MSTVPAPATIRLGSPVAFAWLLTACQVWPTWGDDCAEAGCEPGSSGSSSSGALTVPTTGGGEVQTVTGDDGGTDPGTSTSGAPSEPGTTGTTGDEPVPLPVIVDFWLAPNPIEFAGMIAATVTTEHAEGVRMVVPTEAPIDLVMVEPGVFAGDFAVLSGLLNGEHDALLTPWRNDGEILNGATVLAPYEVKLAAPGSLGFWETGDLIGPGQVAALGVLPGGEVVELGTFFKNGASRCYLRRRTKGGAWTLPDDLVEVLPDVQCSAVDLKIDALGAMHVLVHRQGGDGLRWWLARIPAWGLGASNLGIGAKDETAAALAQHPSGTIAVCGSAPTPSTDVDAMVKIFRPGQPGEPWAFDYQPQDKLPHSFDERARDCVFTGDTLALVGEAFGRHGDDLVERERLFVLRFDTTTKSAAWSVAAEGVKTQSGAQAVDVVDNDRLVVAGYSCEDDCKPEGELRIYDTKHTLLWQVSLGVFPTKVSTVQALAWSPAGYAVVATGGLKNDPAAFTVRAFGQSQVDPLWSFSHKEDQHFQLALALAIGHFGEVYAGGIGASGYPAVAYIGG